MYFMKSSMNVFKRLCVWLLILSVFLGIIYGIRVSDVRLDREVMVKSHQYKEGMAQRAATLRANIIQIDAMLQSNQRNRDNLIAQRHALLAQLNATQTAILWPYVWNGSIFSSIIGEDIYSLQNNYSLIMGRYVAQANTAVQNLKNLLREG